MPGQRRVRRHSRSFKRWWAVTAVAVSLSVAAGLIIANGQAPQTQAAQPSAYVQRAPRGWGHGGEVMLSRSAQSQVLNRAATQPSKQARQRLNTRRETRSQFLAAYARTHAREYRYWLSHRRSLLQEYEAWLRQWRQHHHGKTPPPVVTPTATATSTATPTAAPTASSPTATPTTAAPTATATATATTGSGTTSPTASPTTTSPTATPTTTSPTAPPTTAPTTTPTATATATATPTASPTTSTAAGVTQATSANWAGYAMTGAAGTFTSVAASWMVPPVACGGSAQSSNAVGLDGDGTATIEQIGTEGDCNGDFPLYSAWFQMSPTTAPVSFTNPVKPGDFMTASVTSLGAGSFMLTLFDMTQNWTQITTQTSAAATLGSAEVVAEDPSLNGAVQPLSNFGLFDFLDGAVNNAAIAAPINEVTMVSAAGNTLAVPSPITGGVGNFSVGWDASN